MRQGLYARALMAVAILASCSSSAAGHQATASSHPKRDQASAPRAFCDAIIAFTNAANSGDDPSRPLQTFVTTSPADLRTEVDAFAAAARKAAAARSESAFLAGDFRVRANRIQGDVAKRCNFSVVDVRGGEYRFNGLADRLPAGRTAIHLTNAGHQVHELLLYRRAPGTHGDLVTVLAHNPHADDGRLIPLGATLPVTPGNDTYLTADLTPGDYIAVCFVRDGTHTIDDVLKGAGRDIDHRSLGMVHTFQVG